MDYLLCPKCKNDNFKEVAALLTECKRVILFTRLDPAGQRVTSGETPEVCEVPSRNVSYVCEKCGKTYGMKGWQLVPTWL